MELALRVLRPRGWLRGCARVSDDMEREEGAAFDDTTKSYIMIFAEGERLGCWAMVASVLRATTTRRGHVGYQHLHVRGQVLGWRGKSKLTAYM